MQKAISDNLKNIVLFLGVLLIMVILTEAVLRVLDMPKYSSVAETYRRPDEIRYHSFIPNSYGRVRTSEYDVEFRINSIGLRDREIDPVKQKYRILMLGDSFTEGTGVNINDTISKQLESMLVRRGYNVEVINAGFIGYSPILEYLYLKHEGILLNPDMVILNLDPNDIKDDYDYEKVAVWNNSKVIAVPGSKAERTWTKNIEYFCAKYDLHLCMLTGMTYYTVTGEYQKPYNITIGDINSDRVYTTRFNISDPSVHYERTFGYIKKIKAICDENNITFVLATYPHGHLVNSREWAVGRKRFYLDEFPIYSLDFFTRVRKFASNNKITFINTYYKFNNTSTFPLFYSYDSHMTPAGYRLVALGVFENLKLR